MLFETQNLDAGYGQRRVLKGVTLSFAGGAAGLLGPNGAGKSTLLKTLLGFIPPLAGTATVFGRPMPAGAFEARSRIGYMPEMESFIPGMNGVQFVSYMGEISGLPRAAARERAHEVLQYVGLGESRYRNLETYSLGMKQRAKLAQAIVHDPALLLLDEPTNGLDPQGRTEMLELITDLSRKKGISVILCSHLLKDVETVADEIIVLGNGLVVSKQVANQQQENPSILVYRLRVQGPRDVLLQSLRDAGIAAAIPEDDPAILVQWETVRPTRDLFAQAAAAGCVIHRLEPQHDKLEDVFTKAVSELGNAHL